MHDIEHDTHQDLKLTLATLTWLGYSEGNFRANDATFTSGGQCDDGVKMIVIIAEASVPTYDPGAGGGNQPHATSSASDGKN